MSSKRILIVDDDRLVRRVLASWLEFSYPHYEVVEASNGSEALDQLSQQKGERPFDLILTDYQMPVMNGLVLARNIRQSWPAMPVVLMTGGLSTAPLQDEVRALKLDGFLEKPIDIAELKKFLSHKDKNCSERQRQC